VTTLSRMDQGSQPALPGVVAWRGTAGGAGKPGQ